jgi:hypothetical protein
VFLCHSSGDKERVRQLFHQLMADGVDCWFDEERILPGQYWEYEIDRDQQEQVCTRLPVKGVRNKGGICLEGA